MAAEYGNHESKAAAKVRRRPVKAAAFKAARSGIRQGRPPSHQTPVTSRTARHLRILKGRELLGRRAERPPVKFLSFGVPGAQISALDAAPDGAAVLGQLGPRVEHQLEEREEGKQLLAVALAELGIEGGIELALGRVERERPRLVGIEAVRVV